MQSPPSTTVAWIAAAASVFGALLSAFLTWYNSERKLKGDLNLITIQSQLNTKFEETRKDLENAFARDMARYQASIPERQQLRIHMYKTRELLPQVQNSFVDLANSVPKLKPADLLQAMTKTLGLYSGYRTHLDSGEFVSYNDGLKKTLATIQGTLSRIFLDLHFDGGNESPTPGEMTESLSELDGHTRYAVEQIEAELKIPSD